MKVVRALPIVACLVSIAGSAWPSGASPAAAIHEVAVTVDDLPEAELSATHGDTAAALEVTAKLLATLRRQSVPAVGFVNEQRLYKWGEVDQRIRCLQMWLDAGFELGNHSFSHPSLHHVGLPRFEEDVIRGESVTKALLAGHHMALRYFREPFLESGTDITTKQLLHAFLVGRHYSVVPVTVDPFDWMFAVVYDDARRHGDAELERQVVRAYLSYLGSTFAFAAQLSDHLLGREVKQILLLHANQLNADHLNEALEVVRSQGYRFVSTDEALTDPAYRLEETYVGAEGKTWLQRLAVTRGEPLSPERPPVPAMIEQRYKAAR